MITRLAALVLVFGGTFPASVPPEEQHRAVLNHSLSSTHWAVLAPFGEGARRTALVVDRDTIAIGAGNDEREYSYLIILQGRPPLYGGINRVRIDCRKRTSQALSGGFFVNGHLINFSEHDSSPAMLESGTIKTQMADAVCTEDWRGMVLLDVPADQIGVAAFTPKGGTGE